MIKRVLSIVSLHGTDLHIKRHNTRTVKVLVPSIKTKPRLQKWNYSSTVGCLSYIQGMVCPDITFPVQQCARFCHLSSRDHEEAVKLVCRYLLRTCDKGLILRPKKTKGLQCYIDAYWAGAWTFNPSYDLLSNHCRTGFVILYTGCQIMWKSKIQSITALSTTEAEYISLSSVLREVIVIIHLLEDLY